MHLLANNVADASNFGHAQARPHDVHVTKIAIF